MKKKLIIGLSLIASCLAASSLEGVLFKSSSTLGKSHGGDNHDIDAYSDGIGVVVKSISGSPVNFKKFNEAVLSSGSAAQKEGLSVLDFSHLSEDGIVRLPKIGHFLTCREIFNNKRAHGNGLYEIHPFGDDSRKVNVFCDMNEGGYTLSVLDFSSEKNAAEAEMECAKNNMILAVPRTPQHLSYMMDIVDENYGGDYSNYIKILGIYPKYNGARCDGVPFNSNSCHEWGPRDEGKFFIKDEAVGEPNGDNGVNFSMIYIWNDDRTDHWINDYGHPTASHHVFCSAKGETW